MSSPGYIIKMEIFGGVIQHRVQVLKNDEGTVWFPTYAEAKKFLPPDRTTNLGVSFRYWIEAAPIEAAERVQR